MSDDRSSPSRDYTECAAQLARLHALIRSGDGDSDEAEELRDEMDVCWNRMSPEERDWSGALSADFHVLGSNQPLFLDRPTNRDFRQRLLEAARRDDWAGLRSLLDADIDSADLFDRVLFRAIYWAALKNHESSLEFLRSLANRVDELRWEIEATKTGLDRLARIGKAAGEIAVVRDLSRLALERIDRVSGEINRLMADLRSMVSSAVTPGDASPAWDVVKERFFLAEAGLQAFSEHAA